MSLLVGLSERERLFVHLVRAYPDEGCGVLLGRDEAGLRLVVDVVPVGNEQTDSQRNRYVISPAQFLAAERRARDLGLDVVGFFHSHPDHPAEPSAFDLEHAWPYYSYLIVSVESGRVADTRSWRLADDRSHFVPEPIRETSADGEDPAVDPTPRPTPERGESR